MGKTYIKGENNMSVCKERAWKTLEEISFVRVAGTEKELEAAKYLQQQCQNAGVDAVIEDFEIEMMLKCGSMPFSSTHKPIRGNDAMLQDFKSRNQRAKKGKLPEKPKLAEVDRDMLYYDLAKSVCAILTFDIKKNKLMVSPNANDVFGFDMINYLIEEYPDK